MHLQAQEGGTCYFPSLKSNLTESTENLKNNNNKNNSTRAKKFHLVNIS